MSDTNKRETLLKSGSIVGIMTLLSRVLGFVRDQIIAIVFGAGAATDVFLVAFKIPNFLRRLFAEGAFAQSFVPVFTEYRETRDRASLLDLAAHVSGTFTVVLLGISALGVLMAPVLIMLFAPGFTDDQAQFDLAVHMLRITFPYLLFVSLLAYSGSMLNTFGQFAVPSFTPVLLNVCMIGAALWASPYFEKPVVALAWGVFAAGVAQVCFQLPFLRKLGLLPKPRWDWKHSGVRRILKLMAPAILGSSVAQINLLLDTVIASFLAVGSMSWLYYSDRLMEFPLGLLGVTLGTIILPRLSQEHATKAPEKFRNTIDWAMRAVIIVGIPSAIGLAVLAKPMLVTLFEYGEFKPLDSSMASYSLVAYAFGLPAFILIKIFAPAFFARQDTKTPVRIGIIALITNMAYNLILVLPMVWLDFIAPHMALAIATSLSAWQQAFMLYSNLKKNDIYRASDTLIGFFWKTLPAQALLCVCSLTLANSFNWQIMAASARVSTLLAIIVGSAVAYLIGLYTFGIRPKHLASP